MKKKSGVRAAMAMLSFLVAAGGIIQLSRAWAEDKEILGTIKDILKSEDNTKLFVLDRENVSNTVLVSPDTPIRRQIDLKDIHPGEFAAVIYEDGEKEKIALSTSVGDPAQVEKLKDELLQFAPKLEAPPTPEVPETPEVPKTPEEGEEAPPPGPPGPEGAQAEGKKEDAGFNEDEMAKAKGKKKEKGPLDDVLSPEGPLSQAGAAPPEFVSGKVLALNAEGGKTVMNLQDSSGKEVSITMAPNIQVINRYLKPENLAKGNQVSVFYEDGEEEEKEKTAKSILVGRGAEAAPAPEPAAPAASPAPSTGESNEAAAEDEPPAPESADGY